MICGLLLDQWAKHLINSGIKVCGAYVHLMGHPKVSKTSAKLVNQICSLGWNDRMVWNCRGNSARLCLVPLLFDIFLQLIISRKKHHAGACPVTNSVLRNHQTSRNQFYFYKVCNIEHNRTNSQQTGSFMA